MNRYFSLASADLVVPNQEAWGLLLDFTTLREISETLPGNTSLQNKALTVANEIMNVFDKNDLASIPLARKRAQEVFGEGWEKKKEKIYDEGAEKAQIWGIGYCHIDTAWYVRLSVA
jgi:alpha-mannosidase